MTPPYAPNVLEDSGEFGDNLAEEMDDSAQGMADVGEVRSKINAKGFRKGGPMERMVSEMSDYSSSRR